MSAQLAIPGIPQPALYECGECGSWLPSSAFYSVEPHANVHPSGRCRRCHCAQRNRTR